MTCGKCVQNSVLWTDREAPDVAFPTEEIGEAENSFKVEFEMTHTIFGRIRGCTVMHMSVPGFLR